ncbi:MAG: T9SS type A sorting domain-containing protein, partial [Bacteroidia bacterium]
TKLDNLAGKYRALYGAPFDLQQLSGNPQLNINAITHVKIIDVVGSINPAYARYDKNNAVINDPWPTGFASGGFDLDAVGVIHQAALGVNENHNDRSFAVYPNPFNTLLNIHCSDFNKEEPVRVKIINTLGDVVLETAMDAGHLQLNVEELSAGIYFIRLVSKEHNVTRKLIRN